MILEPGTKLLVVHRRLFEKDKARYFVGTVEQSENNLARVTGNTWTQNQFNGKFVKKEDRRTKIVALGCNGLITYLLPPQVNLSELQFDYSAQGQIFLHDAQNNFKMDLSENAHESKEQPR